MKKTNKSMGLLLSMLSLLLILPSTVFAASPTADVVALRTSCSVQGQNLPDCFTKLTDLQDWISNQRTATTPLTLQVGPGQFGAPDGAGLTCPGGNVSQLTIRGQGPQNSIIEGGVGFSVGGNCSVDARNIRFVGDLEGIIWSSTGSSNWNNIEVHSGFYGWKDTSSCSSPTTHVWTGSRILVSGVFNSGFVTGARGYSAGPCSQNWILGSVVSGTGTGEVTAILAPQNSGFHIYGSNLRAIAAANASFPEPALQGGSIGHGLVAVSAASGAEVHIHGTGIDILGGGAYDSAGLVAGGGARIHAVGVGFSVKTASGQTFTRILNADGTANIQSPYQWSASTTPPAGLSSTDGGDMFVEQGCSTVGCGGSNTGTETHLMVYNNSCSSSGSGPWFDTVTGKCRGVQ